MNENRTKTIAVGAAVALLMSVPAGPLAAAPKSDFWDIVGQVIPLPPTARPLRSTYAPTKARLPVPRPPVPPSPVPRPGTGSVSRASTSPPAPNATAEPASPHDVKTASTSRPALATPRPSMFMAGVPVSDKLKRLVATRLDRYITREQDRKGVAAFYKDNNYTSLWINNRAPSLRATVVSGVMKSADADGLDPASYHIPDFAAASGDPEKLAAAELQFTDAVLTYARHAQAGRFGAQQITPDIGAVQIIPESGQVLKSVSSAGAANAATALNSYNPPFAEYKALKVKLAELRQASDTAGKIPAGPILKRGMSDPRVPALRQRFKLADDPSNDSYDAALFAAVRKFQAQAGIRPDGMIGPRTLAAINAGPSRQDKIDTVIANMERWRWLPRNLGNAHVIVNIPDYSLKVVNHDKTIWTTRVVVGTKKTPTPLLAAAIENILVNPTWHVPESIIYNEYLPALQRDPRALQRMGLYLERAPDGRITVKQPPGQENALGRMKFNFPNRFLVYLHDTPTKYLFARPYRAYSHGCMRVQNPAKFGEVLLSLAMPNSRHTAESLKQMWGGPEIWLRFKRKIPVFVVYFSASVDQTGRLVTHRDVYEWDRLVTAVLKGGLRHLANSYAAPEPKPAEIAVEKRRALEQIVDRQEGFSRFFEQLFQGPPR